MRTLLILLCLNAADAHRLDEYLQATLFSIEKGQIRGELRLTPGIAVLPSVLSQIDTDSSGEVSHQEAQAYARRVLADMELSVDGQRRGLEPAAVRFPSQKQLRQGLGEMQLDFTVVAGIFSAGSHEISFRNRHQRGISVYLVNCVASNDAQLRIEGQQRSYDQSEYRLRFSRRSSMLGVSSWFNAGAIAVIVPLFLILSRLERTSARPPANSIGAIELTSGSLARLAPAQNETAATAKGLPTRRTS